MLCMQSWPPFNNDALLIACLLQPKSVEGTDGKVKPQFCYQQFISTVQDKIHSPRGAWAHPNLSPIQQSYTTAKPSPFFIFVYWNKFCEEPGCFFGHSFNGNLLACWHALQLKVFPMCGGKPVNLRISSENGLKLGPSYLPLPIVADKADQVFPAVTSSMIMFTYSCCNNTLRFTLGISNFTKKKHSLYSWSSIKAI